MKIINLLVLVFLAGPISFAQVRGITHGQEPNLPKPFSGPTVANPPSGNPSPGFTPTALPGFQVSVFAKGFKEPRYLAVAPNGDVFVADSSGNTVYVVHDPGSGKASDGRTTFASNLNEPFGIAFHGNYVYIADTDEVLRFPYDPKTAKPTGDRERILSLPSGGMHSTRTVVFSRDGKQMFVSAGSDCNVCVGSDPRRAAIQVADPDGKNARIYGSGLRNAVGLAVNPDNGVLWADVNERDMLGDNLPPDYFTHVPDGSFLGWPYSYIGKNLDPRVKKKRPDLVAKAIVPDVLVGPHTAPLESTFYTGKQFPASYWHGAFVALHGSWNRSVHSGYEVLFVPFKNGEPAAKPEDFLTGFDPNPHEKAVEGRPVGVAVAKDGSLLVSDDVGNLIWRVSKK
ncbi:MAG TPA: sorbosone dehydrogenase family protein [Terriglobia bacterium]|nr:sorbosone dehydrogenase family protein [Terriglobia bacterium]